MIYVVHYQRLYRLVEAHFILAMCLRYPIAALKNRDARAMVIMCAERLSGVIAVERKRVIQPYVPTDPISQKIPGCHVEAAENASRILHIYLYDSAWLMIVL